MISSFLGVKEIETSGTIVFGRNQSERLIQDFISKLTLLS